MIFEDMTISQLRNLTKQYAQIEKENLFFKMKYPTKAKELKDNPNILKEVGIECF